MDQATLEKLSALAFLFLGLTFLLFALNLMGLKIPFLGIAMLIAALLSLAAGVMLYLDSRKQGQGF